LDLRGEKAGLSAGPSICLHFFAHFAGISIIPPSFPAIVYFLEPRIEI